jgi:hypothetical protein
MCRVTQVTNRTHANYCAARVSRDGVVYRSHTRIDSREELNVLQKSSKVYDLESHTRTYCGV